MTIDWITLIVVLAFLLIIVAAIISVAGFLIRQYLRLMKTIINFAIALTVIIVIAIIAIAAWVMLIK